MNVFESLPSLPYLNDVFTSKQRVLHRHRIQRPFRVEGPKMEITHGRFGCTGTIPLSGLSQHCFIFLQRFARPRKMAGNLERKCIPSAAISVIHQAALEGT